MMARNKAPEPAADHQRHDQSRGDAHVLEILNMDGRHAAQKAQRHVKIFSGNRREAGQQGRRLVIDVGQQPDAIALIETARDLGNIRRRIAIAEQSFELGLLCLREYLPMPGFVEAIDHDAIVSGQLPKDARALVAKRLKAWSADDRLNRAFDDLGIIRRIGRASLDLDDELALRGAVNAARCSESRRGADGAAIAARNRR